MTAPVPPGLDFRSALYLGLRHPAASLAPWSQLSRGMPAAVERDTDADACAQHLARLVGCEAAYLTRSTLHAFWDVFSSSSARPLTVFVDAGAYPIAKWAAACRHAGAGRVRSFRHCDPSALESAVRSTTGPEPILVVADGWCAGCGRPAPLGAYVDVVSRAGGRVVVDDTQALGVFGHAPTARNPYGLDGGGTLRYGSIRSPHLTYVASLAKGFGVPVALVAGSRSVVGRLRGSGPSQVHASPPSAADVAAVHRALWINAQQGQMLRARLLARVRHLRTVLRSYTLGRSHCPLQLLHLSRSQVLEVQAALRHRDIRVLALSTRCAGPAIGVALTAAHTAADVDRLAAAIAEVVPREFPSSRAPVASRA